MSNSQLTDERLRTLSLGQTNTERLSIDILKLNRRYSQVKPRRPLGGPDQGRDIEAVLDNSLSVWGAVGFQQMVSDTVTEKRLAKKKFKDDLHRAKKENPNLRSFVFFTNVDLSGTERAEIEDYAKRNDVSFVDIYWRERIRVELDSPRGIMYRLKYLDIAMTVEEQQAFFAEFSDQVEGLVHERFDAVDTQLHHLRFELDCLKPLYTITFGFVLNREYNAEELGSFRFLAAIENLEMSSPLPHPALWIGGRDLYWGQSPQGDVGVQGIVWSRNPDEQIDVRTGHSFGPTCSQMFIRVQLRGLGPYKKLGDLQHRLMGVWISESLFGHIAKVFLIANDYIVISADAEYLEYQNGSPFLCKWPEELPPSKETLPWVQVVARGSSSMMRMFAGIWNPWDLSFANYTPERIKKPEGLRVPQGLRLFP